MEQIFMIEIFVKKIILKVEPPEKTASELALQELERKQAEEAAAIAAALEAAKLAKKGKKGGAAKKGKGKKGKEPPPPSEEETKFLQTCAMNMQCLPLFDCNVTHDSFVEPPPPPPPPKKGKKGKAKPKPKKGKGKKGKGGPLPRIIILPSEPLPQPPFFGVGETITFISRPSLLKEIMMTTPVYIRVWNRDLELNCVGLVKLTWHESFLTTLDQASELNPVVMDAAEYRNTSSPEIVTNTVEFIRPMHCEEDLKPSGEIEFYIRLSCLGNKLLSHFVTLPEMDRLPGRKYLHDELGLKDLEVVRHWPCSTIDDIPPIAYLFAAPDISREPVIVSKPESPTDGYEDYVAPFTTDELVILSMGFPKGPCGGTNCPRRMDFRGSQHQFIHGEFSAKGKYQHGKFVNKRDVHGPCGRLDCPLAKTVRSYICDEGMYKPCKKPCPKDYY